MVLPLGVSRVSEVWIAGNGLRRAMRCVRRRSAGLRMRSCCVIRLRLLLHTSIHIMSTSTQDQMVTDSYNMDQEEQAPRYYLSQSIVNICISPLLTTYCTSPSYIHIYYVFLHLIRLNLSGIDLDNLILISLWSITGTF